MALIGPSGAGTSTLIRCVNRLVEPTAGRIFLGEGEITGLGLGPLRRVRRRKGLIFKDSAPVARLTVIENVLWGRLGCCGFTSEARGVGEGCVGTFGFVWGQH